MHEADDDRQTQTIARTDRCDRRATPRPAQPARPPGAGSRPRQGRNHGAGVPPRARSAGAARRRRAQSRPAQERRRPDHLPRDHVGLPRARKARHGRLPGPGRHLQRAGRVPAVRRRRRRPAVRLDRRSVPRHRSRHRRFRRGPGRKFVRRRDQPHARPDARHHHHHQRRSVDPGPPQPDDQDRLDGRRHRRLRPFAGAGPVPGLAQPALPATSNGARSPRTPKRP